VREPGELADTFGKALAAGTTALIDVKADKDCPTRSTISAPARAAWSYHE
jgi:hypothetical protein